MGLNQLCFIVNKLTTTFPHLKDKVLILQHEQKHRNHTHGEEIHAMEVIGHKYPICYGKKNPFFFFTFHLSNFFFPCLCIILTKKNETLIFVFLVGTMKSTTF